jgi:hypothetical protein
MAAVGRRCDRGGYRPRGHRCCVAVLKAPGFLAGVQGHAAGAQSVAKSFGARWSILGMSNFLYRHGRIIGKVMGWFFLLGGWRSARTCSG